MKGLMSQYEAAFGKLPTTITLSKQCADPIWYRITPDKNDAAPLEGVCTQSETTLHMEKGLGTRSISWRLTTPNSDPEKTGEEDPNANVIT